MKFIRTYSNIGLLYDTLPWMTLQKWSAVVLKYTGRNYSAQWRFFTNKSSNSINAKLNLNQCRLVLMIFTHVQFSSQIARFTFRFSQFDEFLVSVQEIRLFWRKCHRCVVVSSVPTYLHCTASNSLTAISYSWIAHFGTHFGLYNPVFYARDNTE